MPQKEQIQKIKFNYNQLSNDQQADEIWKVIKALHEQGEKVGIIFSCNDQQASRIYAGYCTGSIKKIIGKSSKHQAKTFRLLSFKIADLKLQDEVHILPLATSIKGKNNTENNVVSQETLIRDLQNIKNHLDDGWFVLVLTNPDDLIMQKNGINQKYQIGGGSSKEFYLPKNQIITAELGTLSQGHFVEKVIDFLFDVYASNSNTSKDEISNNNNNSSSNNGLAILNKLLTKPQRVIYTLLFYVRTALIDNHFIQDDNNIKQIYFSRSYNLRIVCKDTSLVKSLASKLTNYGGKPLNGVRQEQVVKNKTAHTISSQESIISIEHSQAFNFLKYLCNISLHAITAHYEIEIAIRQKYKKVVIEKDIIKIEGKNYSFKECIEQNKLGKAHQQFKDIIQGNGIVLHPENVKSAIEQIMLTLSGTSIISCLLRPLIVNSTNIANSSHNKLTYHRDFNGLLSMKDTDALEELFSLNDSTEKVSKFNLELQQTVLYHYNSITYQACKLYATFKVQDLFSANSTVYSELHTYELKLREFINEEISNETNNFLKILKFWLYLEIAIFAYIKGNYYVTFNVIQALDNYDHFPILQLFPPATIEYFKFLKEQIQNTQTVINKSKYYLHHFGICLPNLASFKVLIKKNLIHQNKDELNRVISGDLSTLLWYCTRYFKELEKNNFLDPSLITLIQKTSLRSSTKSIDLTSINNIKFEKEDELKAFAKRLNKNDFITSLLKSVQKISQLVQQKLKLDINNPLQFKKILALEGKIFSSDSNLLITAIQKVASKEWPISLIEKILKFNLVTLEKVTLTKVHAEVLDIKDDNLPSVILELIQNYCIPSEQTPSVQPMPLDLTNIHFLDLSHSFLKDEFIEKKLISWLQNQFKQVKKLDLSHNQFTLKGLKALMEFLSKTDSTKPALEGLSLQQNYIELYDVAQLKNLTEKLINPILKQVDLSGNLIFCQPQPACLIQFLGILLIKSNLTVGRLLSARFKSLDQLPSTNHEITYKLELVLSDDSIIVISLDSWDLHVYNEIKKEFKFMIERSVLDYYTLELSQRISEISSEIKNLKCSSESLHQSYPQLEKLLDYHPQSPLISQIKTHPIFKSEPLNRATSVLFPEHFITEQMGWVYLVVNRATDHTRLAYEYLTPQGQRVFKTAHLTVEKSDSFFGESKVNINFESGNILEKVKNFHEYYEIAGLRSSTQKLQELDRTIEIEERQKNPNYQYQKLILSSSQDLSRNTPNSIRVNCLKWITDHMRTHLGIDLDISFYNPSEIVQKLRTNPQALLGYAAITIGSTPHSETNQDEENADKTNVNH